MSDFMFKLSDQMQLSGETTYEQIIACQSIYICNTSKIAITGYTIIDADLEIDGLGKIKSSLQVLKDNLKYIVLYPDYREYLEEKERWENPTVDGTIEMEACKEWTTNNICVELNRIYDWGECKIIFEQWNGRAGMMITLK